VGLSFAAEAAADGALMLLAPFLLESGVTLEGVELIKAGVSIVGSAVKGAIQDLLLHNGAEAEEKAAESAAEDFAEGRAKILILRWADNRSKDITEVLRLREAL